jgi:manganese/iron transport system permease protein
MLDQLLTPLQYPFMQRGLLAALMVGVLCSVIGSYVVLRGMAFIGDALAHAVLPGVAVAYLLQGSLFVGALAAGVATALGIGFLIQRAQVKEDTAIGVLFAGFFALGVLLLSTVRSYAVDLTHILFGDVLGVSATDLWVMAGLGVVVLGTVGLLYKELLLMAFDPVLAAAIRLPLNLLRYLFLVLLSVTVVVSIQTVGVALVVAMLVTPAATASLLTHRLSTMMLLSALIGVVSATAGLYLSFYVNAASGATIVLVCTGLFFSVLAFSPKRGLLAAWRRARRTAMLAKTPAVRPATDV